MGRKDRPRPTTASGRSIAPREQRPQFLGSASLALAASALFLFPVFSPATVFLGPFAWLLGSLDAREARRRHVHQTMTGRIGAQVGRALTAIVAAVVGIVFLVFVSELVD